MGNLSNLYISRSFQSLIHLGSDSNATSTLTLLQDGLGNSIGVGVNTSGDVFLSGSLTASLQQGYVWVGDNNGKTKTIATSSLVVNVDTSSLVTTASFNAFTSSTNISITNLNAFTASATGLNTGSLLVTASFDNGTRNLTFTKGNNTTFAVNIPDVSGSSGNFATTGSNTFRGDQTVSGSILLTGNVEMNKDINAGILYPMDGGKSIRIQKQVGINRLSWVDQSNDKLLYLDVDTKDFYVSGNFQAALQNGYTWVGQPDGRSGQVATSSFAGATINTGSFATTGSNTFIGNQTISGSLFQSGSLIQNGLSEISGTINITGSTTIKGTTRFENSSTTITGSLLITGSTTQIGNNLLVGNTTLSGSVFVSGNIEVTNGANLITHNVKAAGSNGLQILANNNAVIAQMGAGGGTQANFPGSLSSGQFSASVITGFGSPTAFSTSVDTRLDNLELKTGSFATTGSNTFIGNQIISGNLAIAGNLTAYTASFISVTGSIVIGGNTILLNTFTPSVRYGGMEVIDSGSNGATGSMLWDSQNDVWLYVNPSGSSYVSARLISGPKSLTLGSEPTLSQNIVPKADDGDHLVDSQISDDGTTVRITNAISASTFTGLGNLTTYSTSVDSRLNNISLLTGSYATTGSNVFTGDQTLIDNAGNFYTISDASGSMLLVAKGFTSASAHLSASSAGGGNLIFKTNDNTADTILSGSANIFVNPQLITAGFKRYLTSANINLTGGLPQISGSMQFSPVITNNYLAGNMTLRGPVSSSVYAITSNNILGTINIGSSAILNAEKLTAGLTMLQNNVAGTFTIIANQSALTGSSTTFSNNAVNGTVTLQLSSSAASLSNNNINDSNFNLINQFSSSSVGLGSVSANVNTIGGASNTFLATGSQLTGSLAFGAAFNQNFVYGNNNTIFVNASDSRVSGSNVYHNSFATGLMGARLIVTGSSNTNDLNSFGSMFVGRWNVDDGRRNKTSDIVFAVGTGISGSRKTGLLIDSGSNSYFEGSLNVSGSSTFTGSVNGNVISMSIVSNTASMDFSLGNYFELSSSVSPLRIELTNVTGGTTKTLALNGTTSSVITWSSNVLQPSGSAYTSSVSGSNDILSFVAFNSNRVNVVSTLKMI